MAQSVDEFGFPIDDAGTTSAAPAKTVGKAPTVDEFGFPIEMQTPPGAEKPFAPPTPKIPGAWPLSFADSDPGGAIPRMGQAFMEGYYGSPNLLTPEAERVVQGWGAIPTAAVHLPETALAIGSGLFRSVQQFGKELLSPINPLLAGDVAAVPEAFAGSPNMLRTAPGVPDWSAPPMPGTLPRGPYSPPGLNLLAGGVEPVMPDITAAAKATAGPTSAVPQLGRNAPPVGSTPTTPAQAKALAGAQYDLAAKSDSGLTPQFNKKLVDAVSPVRETESLVGKNDASDLVEKLRERQDQPLTMKGVQEQDEDMTQLIESHRDITGKLDKVGQQIDDMQDEFRDQIMKAGPGDISGGSEGFEALQKARASWSQAMKMADVQRMWDIAQTRKVPQTNFENRVGTYLNSRKAAGWTAEEKASLADAAKNGFIGGTMHVLGDKLLSAIAGVVGGAKWGLPGVITGEVIAQGGASAARAAENALVARRIGKTMNMLGSSVPLSPMLPTLNPLQVPPP